MFTYMVSYLTRINYGAAIAEMVVATGHAKSMLSVAVTGMSVTYGTGQIVSGFFGDKIQPRTLILWGLIVATAMNALLPLCVSPWLMAVVWCINGFAQAFMWPPMVRLMANQMTELEYKRNTVVVSIGSSSGTVIIYLIVPLLITVADWRYSFWFSALCGLVMIPVWYKLCPLITEQKKEITKSKSNVSLAKTVFAPLMLAVMLGIIIQGMLRDGVTTWMPSYISDTYNLGSSISILTGVCLPIFSMLCFQLSEKLYEYKIKNPLNCAGAMYALGVAAALVLVIMSGKSPAVSVLCTAVLTGSMHGVNLMLIGMVPFYFNGTGRVSLVSGVLNSCTYIGSAVSTYGMAKLTESAGWGATVTSWLVLSVMGTLLCFAIAKAWANKFKENEV